MDGYGPYSVFILINTTAEGDDWKARYAESLVIIEQDRRSLAELEVRYRKLGRAYAAIKEELELLKRRVHVAKAERIDVSQLQLQFDELTKALDALVEQSAEPVAEITPNASESPSDTPPGGGRAGPKDRPKGRRAVVKRVDENHPPDTSESESKTPPLKVWRRLSAWKRATALATNQGVCCESPWTE